jgi:hypothetical protein
MDEVGHSNNPDYMAEQQAKAQKSEEFEAVVIIDVKVDGTALQRALRPTRELISGSIKE